MSRYAIEIPEGVIPAGYRPVAFQCPRLGEYFVSNTGNVLLAKVPADTQHKRLIVEPFPPPRVPLERDDVDATCEFMDGIGQVFSCSFRDTTYVRLNSNKTPIWAYAELADPANGWKYRRASGPWGPVSKEADSGEAR